MSRIQGKEVGVNKWQWQRHGGIKPWVKQLLQRHLRLGRDGEGFSDMGGGTGVGVGRCLRPRLLEVRYDHYFWHTYFQLRCGLLPAHDNWQRNCKGGEGGYGQIPTGLFWIIFIIFLLYYTLIVEPPEWRYRPQSNNSPCTSALIWSENIHKCAALCRQKCHY